MNKYHISSIPQENLRQSETPGSNETFHFSLIILSEQTIINSDQSLVLINFLYLPYRCILKMVERERERGRDKESFIK